MEARVLFMRSIKTIVAKRSSIICYCKLIEANSTIAITDTFTAFADVPIIPTKDTLTLLHRICYLISLAKCTNLRRPRGHTNGVYEYSM